MTRVNRIDIPRFIPTSRLLPLKQVADLAASLGSPAYLVGGFVRDALIQRPINDFDIVLEGDATKLARALVKQHGGRVTIHAPFKTATWFLPTSSDFQPETLDLISARSETYAHPAALPTVTLGTLSDDLRRRDFTINAMAVRLDGDHAGELTDPLGGQDDLERKLVRVLHPNSFIDDPTRLFRLVRYAGRYGFQIAPETQSLIPAALQYVDALSPARLRHELDLVFEEEDSVPMMENLWAWGILGAVQPALPSDEAARARFERTRSHCFMPPRAVPSEIQQRRDWRWIVWLMGLDPKNIRTISKRLHFTADLLKKILAASALYNDLDSLRGLRPSECVARLAGLPEDALMMVWFCAPHGEPRSNLEQYLTKWKSVKPLATGETLKEMGVPFGPRIGEMLTRLRAAWLDGEVTSAEEERRLVEKWMNEGR